MYEHDEIRQWGGRGAREPVEKHIATIKIDLKSGQTRPNPSHHWFDEPYLVEFVHGCDHGLAIVEPVPVSRGDSTPARSKARLAVS